MSDLFQEFDTVSAKQWKQKIQVDLKGADYNEALVWQSLEGIDVRPFYHPDQEIQPKHLTSNEGWHICEKLEAIHLNDTVNLANEALKKGAYSLWFQISSDEFDVTTLLQEFEGISIHLENLNYTPELLKTLAAIASSKKLRLFYHLDPIGQLVRTGTWRTSQAADMQLISQNAAIDSLVAVDITTYQNAGANMVQQLAYALAHATEYVHEGYQNQVTFNVAVGTNYFFEIAKLRALRWLWESIAPEFGVPSHCHITATSTLRNKTLYDYNTNLLRTTTENMSAVLGGADSVCPAPYDHSYHESNDFGRRIARNQLLLLKSESYFDKVEDASEGAYYIEFLTEQLAEKALSLFKDIEKNGGFLKQLQEGTIQRKIKESAAKEQALFDEGQEVLIGTNKYPNPEDRMKDELHKSPFLKVRKVKTTIQPILPKRLSEALEQERLAGEF